MLKTPQYYQLLPGGRESSGVLDLRCVYSSATTIHILHIIVRPAPPPCITQESVTHEDGNTKGNRKCPRIRKSGSMTPSSDDEDATQSPTRTDHVAAAVGSVYAMKVLALSRGPSVIRNSEVSTPSPPRLVRRVFQARDKLQSSQSCSSPVLSAVLTPQQTTLREQTITRFRLELAGKNLTPRRRAFLKFIVDSCSAPLIT